MSYISNIGNLQILDIDPFFIKNIQTITITMVNDGCDYNAIGSVTFLRDKTTGSQQFQGENFNDVSLQIQQFISQLKQKTK